MKKNPVRQLPRSIFLASMIIPIAMIAYGVRIGNILVTGTTKNMLCGAAAFFLAYGLTHLFNGGVAKQPSIS